MAVLYATLGKFKYVILNKIMYLNEWYFNVLKAKLFDNSTEISVQCSVTYTYVNGKICLKVRENKAERGFGLLAQATKQSETRVVH